MFQHRVDMVKAKFYVKVKLFDIDYAINDEDINDDNLDALEFPDRVKIKDLMETDFDKAKEKFIECYGLPKSMVFEVEKNKAKDKEYLCDLITDRTGWLVNSFHSKVIKNKEKEIER